MQKKSLHKVPVISETQFSSTKNIALTSCFAALYVVFSVWNVFPVIGDETRFISAATLAAPLIGIILGPTYGVLSITLGGIASAFLSLSTGVFGPLSFLPHVAAAFASGMLITRKQAICTVSYLLLFLVYALYPLYGPIWLWPFILWLDLIGLIIIASPLQTRATKYLNETSSSLRMGLGVCLTCLSATLFGHVTGSLLYEIFHWYETIGWWTLTWQRVTVTYPVERAMIVVAATVIGAALIRTLRSMH